MIHRPEKKIVSHDGIECNLEEHAITDESVCEIEVATFSEFGKQDVVVGPFHFHHREQEGEVTNNVVDDDT